MEIEFKPEACKGKGAKFGGTIKMKVPTVADSFVIMGEVGFKMSGHEKGNIAVAEINLASFGKIMKILPDYITEMKLTKGEKKVSKWNDLENDRDAMGLLMELAGIMVNGLAPEKN